MGEFPFSFPRRSRGGSIPAWRAEARAEVVCGSFQRAENGGRASRLSRNNPISLVCILSRRRSSPQGSADRKCASQGKSGVVRVDLGGRRLMQKKREHSK